MYIKHSFHNVSGYVLSDEEYQALSFGLDHHIPNFTNYNAAETEFELFYQNILSNISDIPDNELRQLKSKLWNVCHKCIKIKVPYKSNHIIANLTNNKTINALKEEKGRGIVIMDSSKYTEKCLGMLENDQFSNDDPTKSIQSKIKRCVRK